jgi:hypothetical protein
MIDVEEDVLWTAAVLQILSKRLGFLIQANESHGGCLEM